MKKGAIDIGNTRHKAAYFDNMGTIIQLEYFDHLFTALQWLKSEGVGKVMVANVKGSEITTIEGLEIIYLSHTTKLPFKNSYKSPETLGADRLAAMAAVASIYKGDANLVFDIGTCMTIDFLNPQREYFGGNISPGLQMRLKAMHTFTNKLPLSNMEHLHLPAGNDTLSALANGAFIGLKNEIETYISDTLESYPNANIILCGGDAHYFEKQFKYKIFANHNLVLLGLYHLLVFND